MQEAALELDPVTLSQRKRVMWRFYKELWDHADKALIPELFHEGFTFRGSLGPMLTGYEEFGGYVDLVTGAFGDYTSDILAMVEEGDGVAGRLRFHGIHRKPLFGIAPSGRHVWWYGAPFFTFEGDKVRDLWVLGDVHGLIARLSGKNESPPAG